MGYYGRTKHKGEQLVKLFLEKWLTVRTFWVFGPTGITL
nr:sugar nucleotide-binding protein [Paenibacillus puerhi]